MTGIPEPLHISLPRLKTEVGHVVEILEPPISVRIVKLLELQLEVVMVDFVGRNTLLNLHLMAAKLAHNPLPLLSLVQIVKLPGLLLEPVMVDFVGRITFLNLQLMAAKLAHNPRPLLSLVQIVKLLELLLEPVMDLKEKHIS